MKDAMKDAIVYCQELDGFLKALAETLAQMADEPEPENELNEMFKSAGLAFIDENDEMTGEARARYARLAAFALRGWVRCCEIDAANGKDGK